MYKDSEMLSIKSTVHIYMLNITCLQYMKRQSIHDNKFLLCWKIVIYVYLHDF